jgi:hypothetical protein
MRRVTSLTIMAAAIVVTASAVTPAHAASSSNVTTLVIRDHGTFTTTPLTPPFVLTQDQATGHATHLGHTTMQASELINLATFDVTDGSFVITAANGDTIEGTYAGAAAPTSDPMVITYHVTGPITGGTGRFQGAHGQLTWDGMGNLATGVLSDRASGWITR